MQPKILPIVYVLIFALCMYLISLLFHSLVFSVKGLPVVALCIFVTGIIVIIAGAYQFRKAATTVNPLTPNESSALVTNGLYRYSRNPMYIGFLLFLLAWAIFLGNFVSLVFLPLFVLLINKLQIKPEETVLEEKFGEEFREYMQNVRRWI